MKTFMHQQNNENYPLKFCFDRNNSDAAVHCTYVQQLNGLNGNETKQ